jgi:hypothetical protein
MILSMFLHRRQWALAGYYRRSWGYGWQIVSGVMQQWQIAAGVIATNVNLGKDMTTGAVSGVDSVMHLQLLISWQIFEKVHKSHNWDDS